MKMVEDRKATDVLLDLERKINEIHAYMKSMDFKYTLILDRLGKLASVSPSSVGEVVFPSVLPTTANANSPFKASSDLKEKLKKAMEQAQDDELADVPEVATRMEGKRRNLRTHGTAQLRQIPVEQRITYADGKTVYMASVSVSEMDGTFVTKTNTNQTGKWLAALPPGDYRVKVTKAGTQVKPKVEMDYQITIPNQDSRVELEQKKVP